MTLHFNHLFSFVGWGESCSENSVQAKLASSTVQLDFTGLQLVDNQEIAIISYHQSVQPFLWPPSLHEPSLNSRSYHFISNNPIQLGVAQYKVIEFEKTIDICTMALLCLRTIMNHNSGSQQGRRRSRRGPRSKITHKPASIFPDNDGAVLVR